MRLSHHAPDRAGPCLHMLESYGCPWLRSKQTHVGRGMYRDLLRSLFWYAACVFGNTARSQSAVAGQWPLISSIIIVPLTCPVASGASLPTYNTLSTSRLKSMCRRQYKRMRRHVLAADGGHVHTPGESLQDLDQLPWACPSPLPPQDSKLPRFHPRNTGASSEPLKMDRQNNGVVRVGSQS